MWLIADVIHTRAVERGITPEAVCLEPNQFAGSAYTMKKDDSPTALYLEEMLTSGVDPIPEFKFNHFWSGPTPKWAMGHKPYQYKNHKFIRLLCQKK